MITNSTTVGKKTITTTASNPPERPPPELYAESPERTANKLATSAYNAMLFDNRILQALPVDLERRTTSVRSIPGACFSVVGPTPVRNPVLVAYSPTALSALLYLDPNETVLKDPILSAELFSGNKLFIGAEPAAHCYCGHQFGSFAGQLGDGAAMYLGEVVPPIVKAKPLSPEGGAGARGSTDGFLPTSNGEAGQGQGQGQGNQPPQRGRTRKSAGTKGAPVAPVNPHANKPHWELQLKGAGPTPYSRSADGRKVLRSSLREFLASEHMHALGIPTTRAATLITSDSTVERDPLYTGRVVQERCSVVSRVAPSFLRFGSFQVCDPVDPQTQVGGPSRGDITVLRTLFDFSAQTYFKDIMETAKTEATKNSGGVPVAAEVLRYEVSIPLLREITMRTAELVAQWQLVGFCHGVLNTDNMSILGLTVDYGPYGFMTHYDEQHRCNQSDDTGRYAYDQQPDICRWNLHRLACSWSLMFEEGETAPDGGAEAEQEAQDLPTAGRSSAGVHLAASISASIYVSAQQVPKRSEVLSIYESIIETVFEETYEAKRQDLLRNKLGMVSDNWVPAEIKTMERMFYNALRDTSADLTEAFRVLSTVQLVETPSVSHLTRQERQQEVDNALDEAADRIARSCATPEALRKRYAKRMNQLRSHTSPQQLAALLRLAKEEPADFAALFKSPPEVVIPQLQAELERTQESSVYLENFKQAEDLDADTLLATNKEKWVDFLSYYYNMVRKKQDPDEDQGMEERRRREIMRRSNPVFVLRPWILQEVIAAAERGNYSVVQELLDRCTKPYEEDGRDGVLWGSHIAPRDASDISVSCSS